MREDFVSFMAKLVESQNMKNPSLGELRSLFQINQVSKEENQRRNLTSKNFTTHLSALWNFRKLDKWPRRVHVARQRANKAEGISQVPFCLVIFLQAPFNLAKLVKMDCERLVQFSQACETTTEEKQFHNPIFYLQNSPYVIFRYFPTDFVRFLFQDICVITHSLLVISWRYF